MRYQVTHHWGFYLTPSRLYGTHLTRHRSGHIRGQSHHQMALNDDPTPFMSAISQYKPTKRVCRCHATLNHEYVHQQVLHIDTPLPPKYLPKYLAHHSTTLFQHPLEALYYDYLPIATDSTDSTYLVSACKQSIIQEQLINNLPPTYHLATLQVDSLCGLCLNLLNNHSGAPPYSILFCDNMHLIHYQFTTNKLEFYKTYTLSQRYNTTVCELLNQLAQGIERLYITGPNESLYKTLIDELSDSYELTPLQEALAPHIILSQNNHTQRHHELITTLTALTPRLLAC